MKKKKTKPAKSAKTAKRFPRRPVMIVTAIAVVAIAAITVLSRQSASGKQTDQSQKPVVNAADTKYTTVRVAGQDLQVDAQGKIRPLTAEEAQKLADGLKGMLNRSSEGLVEQKHADGSVSMDLQGRFQNVTVARVNEDGSVTTSCVDNPRAAAAFFGIDKKLLETDGAKAPKTPVNQ